VGSSKDIVGIKEAILKAVLLKTAICKFASCVGKGCS